MLPCCSRLKFHSVWVCVFGKRCLYEAFLFALGSYSDSNHMSLRLARKNAAILHSWTPFTFDCSDSAVVITLCFCPLKRAGCVYVCLAWDNIAPPPFLTWPIDLTLI